jgi:parallel beta-helix repeat protein
MKNKIKTITIILFFIISISLVEANNNNSIINKTESYTNKILYVGGYGPDNYSSIQKAINNAQNKDTIYVYEYSSPYAENIIINKTVNLIGENKNKTIIDGGELGTTITFINSQIELKNFTIIGKKEQYNSIGLDIRSSNNKIYKNIIKHNYDGIHINRSDENIIENNEIIQNGRTGILIEESDKNTVSFNIISENDKFGIFYYYSDDNIIKNNILSKNGWDGMVLRFSNRNEVYGNNISGSYYYGVNLHSTNNTNNIFYNNNFKENGANARAENKNSWDNGLKGNYWDDYEEKYPNATKKIRGIWNMPYELDGKDNKDKYPLTKPYKIQKKVEFNNQILIQIIIKYIKILIKI